MPANRLITLAMTSVQMSPLAPPRAICAIRTMPASGASVSAVPVAASAAASIRRARMGARAQRIGEGGFGPAAAASRALMEQGHPGIRNWRVSRPVAPGGWGGIVMETQT